MPTSTFVQLPRPLQRQQLAQLIASHNMELSSSAISQAGFDIDPIESITIAQKLLEITTEGQQGRIRRALHGVTLACQTLDIYYRMAPRSFRHYSQDSVRIGEQHYAIGQLEQAVDSLIDPILDDLLAMLDRAA